MKSLKRRKHAYINVLSMKCPIYDIFIYEMSFNEISFHEMSSMKCPNTYLAFHLALGHFLEKHIIDRTFHRKTCNIFFINV